MSFKILKKDLLKKKSMNIILTVFVLLATMFIASSVNNLMVVTGGMDGYLDLSGVKDYLIITMRNDEGRENEEDIIKFIEESEAVNKYYEDMISYLSKSNMLLENGQSGGLKPALEYAFSGQIDKCVEELKKDNGDSYNSNEKYVMSLYAAYYGTPELYEEAQKYLKATVYSGLVAQVAEANNYDMVKYLLEKYDYDISTEEADEFVLRGFQYALKWGYADICQLFCEKNVKIKKWASGYDELKSAVSSEDLETVKVIYNYIKKKDEITEAELSNAYMWYILKDKEKAKEIADFFFDEGYDLSCVEFCYMDKEFAEYLYENGRPLAPSDLTYAVKSEDPEFVKLVLEKGADPNQDAYWMNFSEAWYINENGDILNYDQYLTDEFTESKVPVMSCAITEANSQIVQLLIDYGADLSLNDYFVDCRYASKATVKVLIEAGADTNMDYSSVNKKGSTLSEYFERYGREDLAELLKEYK